MSLTNNERTPLIGGTAGSALSGEGDVESNNGLGSMSLSLTSSINAVSEAVSKHMGRIGMLGSMSIAVNSLTGPAMLNLPDT